MRIKTKKRIVATVGLLAFLAMICIVGGTERGWVPVSALWWAAALEAVGTFAWQKAGVIRWLWP